jgi:hypothetical protein
MRAAFLAALARWAARHSDSTKIITLPTGPAAAHEVVRVLRAIDRTRSGK